MLKKLSMRKIAVTTLSLFLITLIYLLPNNEKEIKMDNITYTSYEEYKTVFLLDSNLYLSEVKVNITSEKIEEILINKLNSLIINSDNIPKGFQGIIPKDTKILDLTVDNQICTVNFSSDLLRISPVLEEKMIEAIVYSILEEKGVNKVIIKVDGNNLTRLPNSNKLLPNIFDKSYGINKDFEINHLYNLTSTTIYFVGENDKDTYYVPVTKINNNNEEKVKVIVNELKSSLLYQSNLNSYLDSKANLLKWQKDEEVMNLTFDERLFDNVEGKVLEEVVYTISKSVKTNYDVSKVMFYVNDEFVLEA